MALPVEFVVLALELVTLLLGFGLFRVGVSELRGDPPLPLVDGVEDGLVKKTFQQPHQDQEIDRLRADGEPIDEHGSIPRGLGDDVVPERISKDENHRNHEAVDGHRFDHRQTDEQRAGDGGRGVGLLCQRVSAVAIDRPWPSAGAMHPRPVVRPAVTIEAIAIMVVLSIECPWVECAVDSSGRRRFRPGFANLRGGRDVNRR